MSGDQIAALAGVAMALVLVWRSLGSQPTPARAKWQLAALWVVIFVVAVLVLRLFVPQG